MSSAEDLVIIDEQPPVKIWGENFDEIQKIKVYKGKFVVTTDGKFFAKLYPKPEWEEIEYFHDMLVKELGVDDPKSMDVKEMVIGGGKIEVELMDDFAQCRLNGKSTVYGDYEPEAIDSAALETEIQEVFDLDETPVEVIPDYER